MKINEPQTTEFFVENSIRKYLTENRWRVLPRAHHGADIKAYNKNGEYWIIECKGETKGENSNLDFCTSLGQILLRIDKDIRDWRHYGIAVPNTRHFKRQFNKFLKTPKQIRKALKIFFFFVDTEGNIEKIKPY